MGQSKLLYQITGAEYEALMAASYDALRHQEVLPAALEDISQVDMTLEGETYTLTAADSADGPAFAYQGETLESNDFQSALQALTAVSFTDEAPTGKEEIALTLHLEGEGSPPSRSPSTALTGRTAWPRWTANRCVWWSGARRWRSLRRFTPLCSTERHTEKRPRNHLGFRGLSASCQILVKRIVCSGADGPGRWAVPAAYAPVPPATASAAALMVATAAAMPI